ncbi:MAG: sigma-70 family RNA polymerase sigma factor [Myxococcales bacterium]|nr:sigma-70 family RNA polymerase sigma factor [Myxococcales bacterium]
MQTVADPSTTSPPLGKRLASPEIRRLIEGMVRRRVPQGEVDDVVQTVLCDALAADQAPEDDEQLRKWIAGITRHKVADFHRKGSRAPKAELSDAVAGEEPPLSAREWARWAERQTEGDPEAARTLDWMAREGGGEKLAHIAAEEKLPATQVRQRVSRMRRFMKQRWAAELAAVAAIVTVAVLVWRFWPKEEPIAPAPVPEVTPDPRLEEARRLRAEALESCASKAWQECLDQLDAAERIDPDGDDATEIQDARQRAAAALEEEQEKSRAPVDSAEVKKPAPTTDLKLGPPPTSTTPPVKSEPPQKPPLESEPPQKFDPPVKSKVAPKEQTQKPTPKIPPQKSLPSTPSGLKGSSGFDGSSSMGNDFSDTKDGPKNKSWK